ncbi:MAG: 1-acyl-sn-glycerol-3-phosphate acyltransferase [Steroidobacteraceae bacterium]
MTAREPRSTAPTQYGPGNPAHMGPDEDLRRSATAARREVLNGENLRERLRAIAAQGGRSERELLAEAEGYLHELVPENSGAGYRRLIRFARFFYGRGYERELHCDPREVERARALMASHPVAMIMNHRSQVDAFAAYAAMHDHGLPHPFAFGGINMKLPIMGAIMKGSGTVFLRRAFQDNPVYKAVVKAYIDYLTTHRFPLWWSIEGTRSRTGKLAGPRFGLMSWIVDIDERAAAQDLHILPIAISYEQIADVENYAAEQRGARKKPESFRWLVKYLRSMHRSMGHVAVRFGEPVSVQAELEQLRRENPQLARQREKALLRLVVASCLKLNEATPVTGPSLICLVLLQAMPRAVTRLELEREFLQLVRYVEAHGWPTTLHPAHQPLLALEQSLAMLEHHGVIERFTGGSEPIYSIAPGRELSASYYRNNGIHFFVNGAIAELALARALAQRDPARREQDFRDEVLRLRRLLKFEFYFPREAVLFERIGADLDLRCPSWRQLLHSPDPEPGRELREITPLLCHGVLECFVEAYEVVAERLARVPADAAVDPAVFVEACLGEAEQLYRLRRITHAESVAKPILESGCWWPAIAACSSAATMPRRSARVAPASPPSCASSRRGCSWCDTSQRCDAPGADSGTEGACRPACCGSGLAGGWSAHGAGRERVLRGARPDLHEVAAAAAHGAADAQQPVGRPGLARDLVAEARETLPALAGAAHQHAAAARQPLEREQFRDALCAVGAVGVVEQEFVQRPVRVRDVRSEQRVLGREVARFDLGPVRGGERRDRGREGFVVLEVDVGALAARQLAAIAQHAAHPGRIRALDDLVDARQQRLGLADDLDVLGAQSRHDSAQPGLAAQHALEHQVLGGVMHVVRIVVHVADDVAQQVEVRGLVAHGRLALLLDHAHERADVAVLREQALHDGRNGVALHWFSLTKAAEPASRASSPAAG